MPHLWVEYSANLDAHLSIYDFLHDVHADVVADGVFPLAGLRTRAIRVDHYVIADGHLDNAFVHLVLRTLPGRDPTSKQASTDRLFQAVVQRLAPLSERMPLAISMHIEESEPDYGYRVSNYRDHIARRAAGASAPSE